MSRFYPGFSHFLPVGFLGLTNSTVTSELTLSPSQTAVALDIPGVRPSPRPGRRRGALSHALEGPPVGTGALRRPPHGQSGPSTPTPWRGHGFSGVCGVVGGGSGVRPFLQNHHIALLPPCAAPLTHQVRCQRPAEARGSTIKPATGRRYAHHPTTFPSFPPPIPPPCRATNTCPSPKHGCDTGGVNGAVVFFGGVVVFFPFLRGSLSF